MQALATLLAVFNPVCPGDWAEYEVSYTNTSLPQEVPFQTVLHQLLPPPPPQQAEEADFMQWYERGMNECQSYLATHPFQDKQRVSSLFNTEVAESKSCRGNRLLYRTTGLLVWPFGPIGDCEIYSRCWFGLLTCGSFQQEQFTTTFDIPKLTDFYFQGWSMRALHVDMSVSGRELVTPRVRHTTFPTPDHLLPNSTGLVTSVLIADYVLTVNGQYSVEVGLMGLYPRVLYVPSSGNEKRGESQVRGSSGSNSGRSLLNVQLVKRDLAGKKAGGVFKQGTNHSSKGKAHKKTKPAKINKLHNKMQEKQNSKLKFRSESALLKRPDVRSVELLKSVFLGGCERRPDGRSFCVPTCQQQALVRGSPFSMRATLTPTHPHTPLARDSVCGERAMLSTTDRTTTLPPQLPLSPLPFCTGGNHPGRYLRLPPSLLQHCGSEKYSAQLVEERARQFGKRQWFDKYDAIENEYFKHAQTVDMSPVLVEMRRKMQRFSRADAGGRAGDVFSGDSVQREDVYYSELMRYLRMENICLLVDIGVSRKVPDSRADIYAPYSCKYRVYDWNKANKCHMEDRGLTVFHGDSMNRALFGTVLRVGLAVAGIALLDADNHNIEDDKDNYIDDFM